jgi:hypothetical protein
MGLGARILGICGARPYLCRTKLRHHQWPLGIPPRLLERSGWPPRIRAPLRAPRSPRRLASLGTTAASPRLRPSGAERACTERLRAASAARSSRARRAATHGPRGSARPRSATTDGRASCSRRAWAATADRSRRTCSAATGRMGTCPAVRAGSSRGRGSPRWTSDACPAGADWRTPPRTGAGPAGKRFTRG